ncbi:hypothetical protein ACFVHB_39105 [Kitasatospora sp. NPDC127111]|uniref:hypothetical protein n=1 Tax=Kitasatospora sp. NPDC127111 TaxID=3345363 RepID=UPI003624C88B
MRSRIALTAASVAALAAAATACGPDNSGSAAAAPTAAPTTAAATGGATGSAAPAPTSGSTSGASGASGGTSAKPSPGGTAKPSTPAPGDKGGYGQACGANDLTFSAKLETQAGGYVLITAKAKPGITCTLSGAHPTIAFGSTGIEAANAEQAAGEPITLSGSKAAYAGVSPKSSKGNQAVEFGDVIIAIGNADPNPVSIPVGSIKVDKPVVTNWHTDPKQAVPGV